MIAVIAYCYFIFTGRDRDLQKIKRFSWRNERVVLRTFYIRSFVTYQAMCVSSYTLQSFFIQFEEYTGHGGTQIIIAGSKNGFIDSCYQRRSGHIERGRIISNRFLREIVWIFSHHFILTIITGDLDSKILVDIESERLIGQVL